MVRTGKMSFVAHYQTLTYYGHLFHAVLTTMSGRASHQVDLCPLSCICTLTTTTGIEVLCGYLWAGG